jgi:delta 1-pyrroline-5-carboxylate dehydrogenase
VSKELVSFNNDLSVARRAVEAVVGAYPDGGFGCSLMAPRAGNFDALIVEKVFGHDITTAVLGRGASM